MYFLLAEVCVQWILLHLKGVTQLFWYCDKLAWECSEKSSGAAYNFSQVAVVLSITCDSVESGAVWSFGHGVTWPQEQGL